MFDPVEPGSFRTREPRHRRGRPQQPADPYVEPLLGESPQYERLERRGADGVDVLTAFIVGLAVGTLMVSALVLLAVAAS